MTTGSDETFVAMAALITHLGNFEQTMEEEFAVNRSICERSRTTGRQFPGLHPSDVYRSDQNDQLSF